MSITLFGISFRGIGVSRECSDSCPEKKNKYGMAQHAKEMKAIRRWPTGRLICGTFDSEEGHTRTPNGSDKCFGS